MNLLDKHDQYELEILKHVEASPLLNNRVLCSKLGCSVKLAHSVLTGMVSRGLLHVKKHHARRWDYFLTPKGIMEKARLTRDFIAFSMQFYQEARKASSQVCRDIAEEGLKKVAFIGAGDLAEIAFLGVKEWGLELCGIYDDDMEGGTCLGCDVQSISRLRTSGADAIIVCLYDKKAPMSGKYKLPENLGVENKLRWIFEHDKNC